MILMKIKVLSWYFLIKKLSFKTGKQLGFHQAFVYNFVLHIKAKKKNIFRYLDA